MHSEGSAREPDVPAQVNILVSVGLTPEKTRSEDPQITCPMITYKSRETYGLTVRLAAVRLAEVALIVRYADVVPKNGFPVTTLTSLFETRLRAVIDGELV